MSRDTAAAAAFAAGVALVVHARVLGNGFLSLDDADYVTENPIVRRGLTLPGLRWAFNVGHAANWHPLTWLSHMADVTVFGMTPSGHHLTSWLLHAVAAAFAAVFLSEVLAPGGEPVVGARGVAVASGLAAGFWAAHPWRVESVAWVAERKDVLSGVLGLAALLAYLAYAHRPSWRSHAFVTVLLALGLAAKPMLVSLPVLFLVLDRWPLSRRERLARLVAEKAPWALLAGVSCAITLVAQKAGGALATTAVLPLSRRVTNALVALATYASGLFRPGSCAVLYPYPARDWPWPEVAVALALLATLTGGAVALRRRAPWWWAGWAWFLVTLVPVIGLVQVGVQSRADRYTYLPHLGLVVAVAAAMVRACGSRARTVAIASAAGIALVAAGAGSLAYSAAWKDTGTLLTRALSVTRDNAYAHFVLALDLDQRYLDHEAEAHAREAVRLNPSLWLAWDALAHALAMQGRYDEAMEASRESFRVHSDDPWSYVTRGTILLLDRKPAEAVRALERATVLDPRLARAWAGLGDAREQTGNRPGAVDAYERALALDPGSFDAWIGLGIALARAGEDTRARPALDAAGHLLPADPRPFLWRAAIDLRHGDLAAARAEQEALASRNKEMADAVAADIAAADRAARPAESGR